MGDRPEFEFKTPPQKGHESWDANALSSLSSIFRVLGLGPWPVVLYDTVASLPPPNTVDRCCAVVGVGTSKWLYLSDGTAWRRIGRQAAFQPDSTATTIAGFRDDLNLLLENLRTSEWMEGSDPGDPDSKRFTRFAAEVWAKVSLVAPARSSRMGGEVYALSPPTFVSAELTRQAIEIYGRYQAPAANTFNFPRVMSGFLLPYGESSSWSNGARWETNGANAGMVCWRFDFGGPWVSKLKSEYPDRLAMATTAKLMPSDGSLPGTHNDWYLRSPSGAARRIGADTVQFNATSADRVLLLDPRGRSPVSLISSAQFLAREVCDTMAPQTNPWDGVLHDWFWDNPTWEYQNIDYDRNAVADTVPVIQAKYQEDRVNYWVAMRARFIELSGREPYLGYQPGGISAFYLRPNVSMVIAEGWYWNPVWWQLFSNMRNLAQAQYGLPKTLGMGFTNVLEGGEAEENNFTPIDDDVTFRNSEPDHPDFPPNFGALRKQNLRNRMHSFGFIRFTTTFCLLSDAWVQNDIGGHGYAVPYDEYKSDLGQPISEVWRIAKGPVSPNRNPNEDPTWPYNGSGESNLYGAIFIRFFERGAVIHYAPRNYLMTTVEVSSADLDAAWSALGLGGSRPAHYRFIGTQAPVSIWVGACQDRADNGGVWGRETQGTWTPTTKSSWAAGGVDNSLGVLGQQAYYKSGTGGGNWLRFHFRCDRTDDYDVFVKHPYQGLPRNPAYLVSTWAGSPLATDARYTVQHDDGGGTPTTTPVTGINLRDPQRGHKLGRFPFVAGQSYYVELSDLANGVVIADGLYLQAVNARHNDGTELTAQAMFGGVGSLREYNPLGDGSANWTKVIVGDGIVLKTAQSFRSLAGGIVGCFPCHDTTPGTNHKECEYTGAWTSTADASHMQDNAPTLPGPIQNDNPYYSQTVWNAEVDGIDSFGYRSIAAGTSGAKASYQYRVTVAGTYVVQEWHGWVGKTKSGAECSSVPWDLKVNDVSQFTGAVNQAVGEGRWNNVATLLSLSVGDEVEFILDAAGASGGTTVISDAVRFLLI